MNELRIRAFDVLRNADDGCFLRFARGDDALWVTNLPQRVDDVAGVMRRLQAIGLACRVDEHKGLMYLDPTTEIFASWLDGLPSAPPPLPADDALHPAYALARLLLLHPAPLQSQPPGPIWRVVKLAHGARAPMLNAIPKLHAECAAMLRGRTPLPSVAGRVLTSWILKEEEK